MIKYPFLLRFEEMVIKIKKVMNYFGYIFSYCLSSNPNFGNSKAKIFFGFATSKLSAASLKIIKLKNLFGNNIRHNTIYLCGASMPAWFCKWAKNRGVKVILNQNGVYYPGWYGSGYKEANKRYLDNYYRLADFIIFQNNFCKESADHYLGKTYCRSEIIPNPVSTNLFKPKSGKNFNKNAPVLLTTGIFYKEVKYDQMQLILYSFFTLKKTLPCAKLVIAGKIHTPMYRKLKTDIKYESIRESITILPPYDYKSAPSIYQLGDIYLNARFNDPCPSAVLEAMSCGLPVVFLDCGGTPELVGDAGEGVTVTKSWDHFEYPEPESVNSAIMKVIDNYQTYSEKARLRCVTMFDENIWKKKHEEIFLRITTC